MIVVERKPLSEIKSFVEDFSRILILGCGTCTTVCLAGGEAEVKVVASGLRISFLQDGKGVEILEDCITRQCEPEFLEAAQQKVRHGAIEAVVSLGCGVGVNLMAELLETVPVFPGVDTEFFGAAVEPGMWQEMCAGCGHCILQLTGGICPIARCSKSLLNGPCGGTKNGKCEIDEDLDCCWSLIVERMRSLGTLDRLEDIIPPNDWSTSRHGGPRRVIREEVAVIPDDDEESGRT